MTNPSETPAHRYSPELAATIEKTWQKFWIDNGTFNAPNPVGDLAPTGGETLPEEKLFVQDMFPFPSGAGLHVGHPLGCHRRVRTIQPNAGQKRAAYPGL